MQTSPVSYILHFQRIKTPPSRNFADKTIIIAALLFASQNKKPSYVWTVKFLWLGSISERHCVQYLPSYLGGANTSP